MTQFECYDLISVGTPCFAKCVTMI